MNKKAGKRGKDIEMMNDDMIKKLEKMGFSRWTKGNMDRLYISAKCLGLECAYYNTGNIKDAFFNGERVSNSEGRRMMAAKTYIDIATGKLVGTHSELKKAAEELIKKAEGEE